LLSINSFTTLINDLKSWVLWMECTHSSQIRTVSIHFLNMSLYLVVTSLFLYLQY
jgi:hypothetical protein